MATNAEQGLSERVVAAAPLGVSGASGNRLERVTLDDGRELIRKRVSPEWDWISRATGDGGRALTMWQRGLFDRIPASVDHATVSVETDDAGWSVYMRDVSAALVGPDERLDRDAVRRLLAALAELHHAFRDEVVADLCSLEDRYRLLSPATARRETDLGSPAGPLIARCWDAFLEFVPDDVGRAIVALAEEPALLAEQLRRCEQTLVHGDVRLSNLGVQPDGVVLIDWGERTGPAPPGVELASFLVFDAARLDVGRDDVIEDFRVASGDFFDERAFKLALLGGMVQLGPHPVLDFVINGGDEARHTAREELAWWTTRVRASLEEWSPL